jgi:hypothetical protein
MTTHKNDANGNLNNIIDALQQELSMAEPSSQVMG